MYRSLIEYQLFTSHLESPPATFSKKKKKAYFHYKFIFYLRTLCSLSGNFNRVSHRIDKFSSINDLGLSFLFSLLMNIYEVLLMCRATE